MTNQIDIRDVCCVALELKPVELGVRLLTAGRWQNQCPQNWRW